MTQFAVLHCLRASPTVHLLAMLVRGLTPCSLVNLHQKIKWIICFFIKIQLDNVGIGLVGFTQRMFIKVVKNLGRASAWPEPSGRGSLNRIFTHKSIFNARRRYFHSFKSCEVVVKECEW